jgi:Tfp pilus assembly protein PilE
VSKNSYLGEKNMKRHQGGFGGLQLLLVVAVIGMTSMVTVPKYKSFMAKAKLSEAFIFAGESKQKLSQFYMVNNRFPKNAKESAAMVTVSLSPPEVVREMVVIPGRDNHDIVVMVYLKDGVVENKTGQEQFIYITADKPSGSGSSYVEWGCGASGVGAELLPDHCKA